MYHALWTQDRDSDLDPALGELRAQVKAAGGTLLTVQPLDHLKSPLSSSLFILVTSIESGHLGTPSGAPYGHLWCQRQLCPHPARSASSRGGCMFQPGPEERGKGWSLR